MKNLIMVASQTHIDVCDAGPCVVQTTSSETLDLASRQRKLTPERLAAQLLCYDFQLESKELIVMCFDCDALYNCVVGLTALCLLCSWFPYLSSFCSQSNISISAS